MNASILGCLLVQRLGRHEEALAECRLALERLPECADLYTSLSNTLQNMGEWDAALGVLTRGIDRNTSPWPLHIARASLHSRFGRFGAARDDYAAAASFVPSHPLWNYVDAMMSYSTGHKDEYRRACETLLRQAEETAEPNITRRTIKAWLCAPRTDEEFQRYASMMDYVIRTAANTSWTWVVHGQWLFERGEIAKAIEELERCRGPRIEGYPRLFACCTLAKAYQRLGNSESAAERLKEARGVLSQSMSNGLDSSPWDLLCSIERFRNAAALLQREVQSLERELEAHVLLANRRPKDAADIASRILDQHDNRDFLLFRAELMGRARRWREAASDMTRCLEIEDDGWLATRCAIALAASDDTNAFRGQAQRLLDSIEKANKIVRCQWRSTSLMLARLPENDPWIVHSLEGRKQTR